MKRKINIKSIAILCSIVIFLFLIGWGGGSLYSYKIKSATCSDGVLFIPQGSNFETLSDSLLSGKLLANPRQFARFAKYKELDKNVQPGRYEIKKGMSYSTLINTLLNARQSPVNVTFNNVRTIDRLAGALSRKIELDSTEILAALKNDSIAKSYGYTPQTFISMFIPNTYQFYWTVSMTELLDRMKKENEKFWNKRETELKKSGLSKADVMTLASIVYEETKNRSEMPRVAGVYLNRLRIGMPLQADPTVKFAIGDFSIKRVLNKHLEVNSPYNTYKNQGLPPSPICMPSISAIDAVLNYEKHNYLYFCAKDDLSGSHNFASTLSEHNKNAQAYARALNRLKIK